MPISSPSRLDEIRVANPELALAVYALTPGGAVTLEIITPDEQVFQFVRETETAVLDAAFPPDPPTIDLFA